MKPAPAPYQGQAWLQHAVPQKISVRRGTVAMPALTSASQDRILPHDGLPVRPRGSGSHQSVRLQETARGPPVEPIGSRPLEVGRALPRGPRAINQEEMGVATVIARQAAGLLPRPHDKACVIKSTTTVISSQQDPPTAGAACRLRTRPVSGPQQSAEKSEVRGTDGWARAQSDYHCTPGGRPI